MDRNRNAARMLASLMVWGLLAGISGCGTAPGGGLALFPDTHRLLKVTDQIRNCAPQPAPVARELQKTVIPEYLIEPGDVLLVEPVAVDTPLRFPADQTVLVDGTIDLGQFGRLRVVGLTVEQIEAEIESLIQKANILFEGKPLTAEQGEVNVRLMAPNAALFYVLGEVNSPGSFPLIGRETVLDAILAAGGLSDRASKCRIILTRPSHHCDCRTVLPVCWDQIIQLGDTTTNYQIMPGDRIFVATETCCEGMGHCCTGGECKLCQRNQCMTTCPPTVPPPTLYSAPPVEQPATVHLAPAPDVTAPSPEPMPPVVPETGRQD